MTKIKITTRIMSQPNGSSKLKLTVKNGWSFWNRFTVKDSKDLRDYLKSDKFKEYAYGIFSKYEGMTYKEICDTDRKSDFQKIWDKLDGFAWRTVESNYYNDFHIKITKRERLDDNCGVFTSYMYITGRIYNNDLSRYRRFYTIVDFCTEDIYLDELERAYYDKYEDYDVDTYSEFQEEFDRTFEVTDKKIKDYTDMLFYCGYAEYINSFNDCKRFFEICNDSINGYNNRFNRAA